MTVEWMTKHWAEDFKYPVDYNYPNTSARGSQTRSESVQRRNAVMQWCKEQDIEYDWRGGELMYRLYFLTEEEATMFKLAWGI